MRDGRLRLHDPATGSAQIIATIPVYTNSEDGLYGPAVDADFATNKWVYLYYAPVNMDGLSNSGSPYPAQTPNGDAPTTPSADPSVWDQWKGYFQLSRFKFVDGPNPSLDMASEQKIMRVEVNRGACCHVAGDIDFDKQGNLWMVTGDDTPATAVEREQQPAPERLEDQREPDDRRRRSDRRHVHADLRRPDDRADRVPARQHGDRGARWRRCRTSTTSRSPAPAHAR